MSTTHFFFLGMCTCQPCITHLFHCMNMPQHCQEPHCQEHGGWYTNGGYRCYKQHCPFISKKEACSICHSNLFASIAFTVCLCRWPTKRLVAVPAVKHEEASDIELWPVSQQSKGKACLWSPVIVLSDESGHDQFSNTPKAKEHLSASGTMPEVLENQQCLLTIYLSLLLLIVFSLYVEHLRVHLPLVQWQIQQVGVYRVPLPVMARRIQVLPMCLPGASISLTGVSDLVWMVASAASYAQFDLLILTRHQLMRLLTYMILILINPSSFKAIFFYPCLRSQCCHMFFDFSILRACFDSFVLLDH